MLKSALGVLVSLFAFCGAVLTAQAESTSVSKTVKKPAAQKAVAKYNVPAKRSHAAKSKKVAAAAKRSSSAKKQQQGYISRVSSADDMAELQRISRPQALASNAALVIDQHTSEVLFEKSAEVAVPIASLTKLMTALVVVESGQDMSEILEVTADDIDQEKNTSSRLRVGSQLSRDDMLHIALMSSENRAASALGRHYPGGLVDFVATMNEKAKELGMHDTHFVEPTGLSSLNVSSARDLAKLVMAAHKHAIIREYSTYPKYTVNAGGYRLQYVNSNSLVVNPSWDIGLQKTGYITEAGRCLVMQARIDDRPVVMVFLDSKGKYSRIGDARRIRKWLEISKPEVIVQASAHQS